jgi:tetratricopeptide (TPR) repeat protein
MDALPICERLLNKAIRDGDEDRASEHRRTMTRITLGLEDLPRAMTAALAAYEARPTPEMAEDVVEVCHRARGDAALVTRARSALDAITGQRDELGPPCLAKLGEVAVSFGSASAARALFRQALGGDPCCTPALVGLTALADEPTTSSEAAELTVRAAAHVDTKEERFRLLVKAGELFTFGANDLGMGAAAFEEARTVVPRDHRVLHTLVWIYCELGEWTFLSEILRSIADSEAEPVRRAKGIYAMALVLRDKVGDVTRAAAAFEQVLDLDPSRLEAFERLVRVHTERRDWPRLAKSYERMILRTAQESEADQKHALYFQLALVQRDRLGDVLEALRALRSAAQLKPDNATTRKALIELLVIAGQLDDAMEVALGAVALRPEDPSACAEVYDVAMRLRAYDLGWRAVDARKAAGGATDEVQEQFHREFGVTPLAAATKPLVPPEWKRLFHPKIDPLLTGILAYATRAVLRSPRVRATREQSARALGSPIKPTTQDAARVLAAVRRGAELLGVGMPSLHPCKTTSPFEVIPSAPALLVSLEACRALGDASLAFLVGKHLAAAEPELLAAIVFPTLQELDALVGAALRALDPARVSDEAPGPFDRMVRDAITTDELERVRSLGASARARGGKFDVAQWKRHADASASRVGMLLAGSLEGARKALVGSPLAAGAMPARDQVNELVVMSLGEVYGGLRKSIGVAVRD